jgi:hypothetical protein
VCFQSAILHRPSSGFFFPGLPSTDIILDPRFDTDLPLQVDDEHWDHPTHPFQQPAHTPSRVTFFNALMGLNHILGLSLQILMRTPLL